MASIRLVQTGDDHLHNLSDEFLSCKGDRHDFPKLRVGPLADGVTAKHIKNGVYQLIYTCPDCGTKRTKTTLRGGVLDPGATYAYDHPKGYLAPKGAGLTRGDYTAELGRREAPYVRTAGSGQAPATAKPRARRGKGSTA